jgi:hypothetical protein
VMADDVADDLGESMLVKDEDFEPPEVPFQPKPTSVSIAALLDNSVSTGSTDFSGDSNFTTHPKGVAGDFHEQSTVILEEGRGRSSTQSPARDRASTAGARPSKKPVYGESVHDANTVIINTRERQRNRG